MFTNCHQVLYNRVTKYLGWPSCLLVKKLE